MKPALLITATMAACAGVLAACSSAEPAAASSSLENSCLSPADITGQTIVSDQEIRFELRNGETWVNRLPRSCPGLKTEGGFAWDVRGMRICSNQDRITVLNTGTPCLLGEFNRVPPT